MGFSNGDARAARSVDYGSYDCTIYSNNGVSNVKKNMENDIEAGVMLVFHRDHILIRSYF